MSGIVLALLAAAPATAASAPVAAPTPAMTESIFISSAADIAAAPEGPTLIRSVWNRGNSSRWIPLSEFPNALLPAGESETTVRLHLTIDADDTIAQCRPLAVSWYDKAAKQRVEGDQRLGSLGCSLMRKYARYLHGIDGAGKPVSAEIVREIMFRRSATPVILAPAPGHPWGWVGTGRYEPGAWPPQSSTPRAVLAEPKWKGFLAPAKDLPRSGATGAILSIAADGTPAGCSIGRSSGDARIDAASCAGLMATRFQPFRFPTAGTPFLVRWSGRNAELVLPRSLARPELVAPIVITEADRLAAALPDQPFIRLRISVDMAGKPVRCEIDASNLGDAGDAASCALVMARARFTAPRNAFAEPSPGGMNLRIDWTRLSVQRDGYY